MVPRVTKLQLTTVHELLLNSFYEIPRFQRPYEWNAEILSQFWEDVVKENDVGYFVGPMVAYESAPMTKALVDGQQRLTTIIFVLCAVRDAFRELGESDLGSGVAEIVERRQIDFKPRLVLSSVDGGEAFTGVLTADVGSFSSSPKDEGQKAIQTGFRLVQRALADHVATAVDQGLFEREVQVLADVRDRFLGLQVIWIEQGDEESAYIIFETMNSRGKDLEPVDMLKNLLFSAKLEENADHDSIRERWLQMRQLLHDRQVNVGHFLHHWWLARESFVAERKLYSRMKEKYKAISPTSAVRVVEALDTAAREYVKIADPDRTIWAQHEREARESISAMRRFNLRQPRPLILAMLLAYSEKRMKIKQLTQMLRMIEAFHYASTVIAQMSSTGGVSQMYASLANKVSKLSMENQSQSQRQLADKFRASNRLPTRQAFEGQFVEALNFESAKPAVRYTLRKWHEFNGRTPLDDDLCSIEHFAPQSLGETWVHEIGNLVWLSMELNNQLAAKSVAAKRKHLLDHPAASASFYVADLTGVEDWNEAAAAERAGLISARMYDWVVATLGIVEED